MEQSAILAQHPILRIADLQEISLKGGAKVYRIKERTVTAALLNEYVDVQLLPGDPGPGLSAGPVAFYLSDDGERFILPQSDRVILVQDLGGSTGKQVEIDVTGAVTTPSGSETLSLLVAEPSSQFHNSTYPLASGRIYPAQKIQSIDGATRKYLVFLQGFGPIGKTFDLVAGTDALTLDLDTGGQVISFRGDVSADLGFVVWRTLGLQTYGTESDYYCGMKIQTLSSGADGFQSGGFSRLYKSWATAIDYAQGAFADKICQNDKIAYSSNTEAHIKTAGTGIPDKDSFFPDVDLYVAQPNGYPQFYEFSDPSRKSVLASNTKTPSAPRWALQAKTAYPKYDPITDTGGSGDYMAVDAGGAYPSFVIPTAAVGWNDEATEYLIALTDYNQTQGLLIPGWEFFGKAWYYCLVGVYQNNVVLPWADGKASHFRGGRVYAPRTMSAWWFWDTYYGTYTWIHPPMAGWSTGGLDIRIGDKWKSKRKDMDYVAGYDIYTYIQFIAG